MAKGLGVVTKVSLEFLMDSAIGMESLVTNIFAKAIADTWDNAAFYGSGGSEPSGMLNVGAITKTGLAGAPRTTTL